MQTLIGTSGYSYPAWKGSFYPSDLPTKKMLPYYAGKLGTVEINNTFYRMPTAALLEGWAAQVPDSFRFAIKAPQRITHQLRLRDAGGLVGELWQLTALLGDKEGPTLFQLPPFAKKDAGLLRDFLASLPKRGQAAFEFRHASWFDDEIFAILGDGGAALCIADDEKLTTPVVATARWGYLRLRRQDYVDGDIRAWAGKIAAQTWERAFVYFKHEDEGTGPRWAAQLMSHM